MNRTSTKTFSIQVKLALTDTHKAFLEKSFYFAEVIYNETVKYADKQIRKLEMDARYKKARGKERTNLINKYKLNQAGLYSFVKVIGKKYKKYLDSITVQAIADRVLVSVQKYLYKNGKRLHFKKRGDLDSIQGKTNHNKLSYDVENNIVRFMNMKMKVRNSDLKDDYVKEALKNRIKFVMIKRMPFNNGYHYYLQIVLEGNPPNKKVKDLSGDVGIDIGTSTIAVCSAEKCILRELAPNSKKYLSKLNKVMIKMEHSRRLNNPDNFNDDGTIKRGKLKWFYSKNYRKLQWKLKTLHRKRSSYVKCEHEKLANEIISLGNNINVERMSFTGLQRKGKLEKNTKGTFKRRKRFGKSLLNASPSMLISIIDRKLGYIDKWINEVDTNTFRASQYNHITDEYTKKKLSQRTVQIGNEKVQRDLYSAFLLMNSRLDLKGTNRDKCLERFESFIQNHNSLIVETINSNIKRPISFGF